MKDNNIIKSTIYNDLLQRLDELSFGFPKSYIGSDKALVKKIFSKQDAYDFINMGLDWVNVESYSKMNNITEDESQEKLERMVKKGIIFKRHRDIDEYKAFPFVMGFMEWQVNNTNKMFLMHTGMYMISSNFGSRMSQSMPFYRTVPINKEFVEGSIVMPYDDIDAILDRHTKFAVATCICRLMYRMKPFNQCHHPLETCIVTDDFATYYIENELGREITKEEARNIIMDGKNDGRVINVTNSKDGENICSCCKCGCGMLYLKTKYPGPSGDLWSNYYSTIDEEKCVKCGKCVQTCPFDYISKDKNGKIKLDQKSCLGCGLCVNKCPTGALKLHQKTSTYEPPETYFDAMEIWRETTKKDYKNFK